MRSKDRIFNWLIIWMGLIFLFMMIGAACSEQIGQPVTIPVGATVVNIIVVPALECNGTICVDEWGQCYEQGSIENVDEMVQVECE